MIHIWNSIAIATLALSFGCASSVSPDASSPTDAQTGGDSTTVPDADPATYTSCSTEADCAWTEFGAEILTRANCPCVFGCANNVVNVTTAQRRQAAYNMLCTPGVDGNGNMCPVDDCAMPPAAQCQAGVCVPPR
jgi:hypothetical protein